MMGLYTVGPSDDNPVVVSTPSAKSPAGSGYLKLDSQALVAVAGQSTHEGGDGENSPEFSRDERSNYVDLVDPFGMPVLIWKNYAEAPRANDPDYRIAAISYDPNIE